MATYEEIYGKRVKEFDSDPTLESSYEGQVWYDKSTGVLKSVVSFTSWSSTTSIPTGKYYGSGAGEQNSTLIFAGLYDSTTLQNTSYEYNGGGWLTEGNVNTGRRSTGGTGTSTAALLVGGYPDPTGNKTEEYDGSSWTETGNVPRQGHGMGVFGIQTAAYACGGSTGPNTTTVDVYNGSTWTSGTALSTARFAAQGGGTTSAGLIFGGDPGFGSGSTATESWDGSSWTTLANLNTGRTDFAGGGSQTAALGWAGRQSGPTDSVKTEQWNGTSWTEVGNYPTGTNAPQGSSGPGTSTAATAAGGAAPGPVATANEFNQSINTFTGSAFASGGVYPAQYYGLASSTNGTQNAALGFGGNYPGGTSGNTTTNAYDGSSWTAQPAMSTARAYLAGFGTSTAAVAVGGLVPPGATGSNAVEEFTGSWTAGNTIPQAGWNQGACGTLTAGLVAFGTNPAYPGQYALTFEYDGTNWTAANAGPTATNDSKGMGVQTSALFAGGGPPSAEAKQSYEYDGTNWTAGGTLSIDHKAGGTLGTSKDLGIITGGHSPSPGTNKTEGYDGTAWSSRPSMATTRGRMGMSGNNDSGVVFGGNPSATNATEEWTNATETVTAATLTSS